MKNIVKTCNCGLVLRMRRSAWCREYSWRLCRQNGKRRWLSCFLSIATQSKRMSAEFTAVLLLPKTATTALWGCQKIFWTIVIPDVNSSNHFWRSSHYKAYLRVGLIMKPEFILGNQLRQYSETTQASKWGNNTGSHWKMNLLPYGKKDSLWWRTDGKTS